MSDVSVCKTLSTPLLVTWKRSSINIEQTAAASRELERIFREAKHSQLPWHQAQTIRHAVTPILRMAGWADDLIQENFNPAGHHLQHADLRLGNRFRTEGIIEVKPFGQDIYKSENRPKYANPLDQLIRYLDESHLELGMLTDGVDWLIIRRSPIYITSDTDVRFTGLRFKLDDIYIDLDCVPEFLGMLSPQAVSGWGEEVKLKCSVVLKTEHMAGSYQRSGVLLAELTNRPTGTNRQGMNVTRYFRP